MATVSVVLGYRAASDVPVMRTDTVGSEALASAAASAQSTLVASFTAFWEVTSTGDVWVTFGMDPTAEEGTTFLVLANTTRHFQSRVGDKIAVIDA